MTIIENNNETLITQIESQRNEIDSLYKQIELGRQLIEQYEKRLSQHKEEMAQYKQEHPTSIRDFDELKKTMEAEGGLSEQVVKLRQKLYETQTELEQEKSKTKSIMGLVNQIQAIGGNSFNISSFSSENIQKRIESETEKINSSSATPIFQSKKRIYPSSSIELSKTLSDINIRPPLNSPVGVRPSFERGNSIVKNRVRNQTPTIRNLNGEWDYEMNSDGEITYINKTTGEKSKIHPDFTQIESKGKKISWFSKRATKKLNVSPSKM